MEKQDVRLTYSNESPVSGYIKPILKSTTPPCGGNYSGDKFQNPWGAAIGWEQVACFSTKVSLIFDPEGSAAIMSLRVLRQKGVLKITEDHWGRLGGRSEARRARQATIALCKGKNAEGKSESQAGKKRNS